MDDQPTPGATPAARPVSRHNIAEAWALWRYAWGRFRGDRCLRLAASLSYTSLLAIVPLSAIAFSMFAAFPVFKGLRERIQGMLFENLLPESALAISGYFTRFVDNTDGLTTLGVVGLALTSMLLLSTIESAINRIFRIAWPRPLVPRMLVFWALITLGPLAFGASLSLSTYLFAVTRWAGLADGVVSVGWATAALPTLMIVAALTFFYVVVPNRRISFGAGLAGGVVAGLMFAVLRRLFAYYVTGFPSFEAIYGAVSLLPIILIWTYLVWTVVLFGAVVTAAVDEWRALGGWLLDTGGGRARGLLIALSILERLLQASQEGEAASRGEILRHATGDARAERVLEDLRQGGFVERTAQGGWVLCRDLSHATLYDLARALGLAIGGGGQLRAGLAAHHPVLAQALGEADRVQRDSLSVPVRDLLEVDDRPIR